jgi:hypothetical protein
MKKVYEVLATQLTYVKMYVEAEDESEAFTQALEEGDWKQCGKIGEVNITDVQLAEEADWNEASFQRFCDQYGNNSYPKSA